MVDNKVFSLMTINPYTLNSLYNQGIIDHVPYDLCMGMPMTSSGMTEAMGLNTMPQMGSMNPMMAGGAMGVGQNSYGMTSSMNGSQYLDSAMKGEMYGYYGNSNDTFVRSSNSSTQQTKSSSIKEMLGMGNGVGRDYNFARAAYGVGTGADADFERMANDRDGQNFRMSITEAASEAKEGVMNSHPVVKGLIATAGVALTLILALKGLKKKPAGDVVEKTGVFTKIKNWGIWSKINPKNWCKKK